MARLFFSLIIVAGVLTTFKQRWLHGFAIVLAVASLGLNWVEEFRPGGALTILNTGLSLIYLGFLLAMVTAQVFRGGTGDRPPDSRRHRDLPAFGGIWALLYQVVALTIPQAFRLPEGLTGGDPDALRRELTYLQFHHSHHYRVRRYHPGPPGGPHPGHARGPGGAALPGHHPGLAGVFGSYAPKRKTLKFSRSERDEVNPYESGYQ